MRREHRELFVGLFMVGWCLWLLYKNLCRPAGSGLERGHLIQSKRTLDRNIIITCYQQLLDPIPQRHSKMATAVLVPMSAINLNGGVLPSSAITQHSPRHGRSRGASISKGKGGRSRGYSLVDDRETTVSKAVIFVLKRVGTVKEQEGDDASVSDEGADNGTIIADADGWVAVDDVVSDMIAFPLNHIRHALTADSSPTKECHL